MVHYTVPVVFNTLEAIPTTGYNSDDLMIHDLSKVSHLCRPISTCIPDALKAQYKKQRELQRQKGLLPPLIKIVDLKATDKKKEVPAEPKSESDSENDFDSESESDSEFEAEINNLQSEINQSLAQLERQRDRLLRENRLLIQRRDMLLQALRRLARLRDDDDDTNN
ncbi:hypothetical protein MrNuV_ORF034 [Macrobrachium rosenbergii nudivirus]|nr:hypothetical protein MrNuV_ORF034 [Macrobrachium rosenbergii nudivirus]